MQAIADIIRRIPAFQGADGQVLPGRTSRLSAPERHRRSPLPVRPRRKDEVREQLTEPCWPAWCPPQYLIDALHRYREETRVIEFLTPDYDKLIKVARARRGQAAGVLRAEQAPVHDARAAQDQRAAADARRRQGARWRHDEEEIKAAYEQDQGEIQRSREAARSAAGLPGQGGGGEGLRGAVQGQELQRGRRQARLQGEPTSTSASSPARR